VIIAYNTDGRSRSIHPVHGIIQRLKRPTGGFADLQVTSD